MEKSNNNSTFRANKVEPKARSKSVFTGGLTCVIMKVTCVILCFSSLVAGIWSMTWHNVMFAGMFYAIYSTIRHEEDR